VGRVMPSSSAASPILKCLAFIFLSKRKEKQMIIQKEQKDGSLARCATDRRPAAGPLVGRARVPPRALCLHPHTVRHLQNFFSLLYQLSIIFNNYKLDNKSGRRRRATRRGSCTSPPTGWSGSRPSPRRRCSCFGASAGPSPFPTPTSAPSSPTYTPPSPPYPPLMFLTTRHDTTRHDQRHDTRSPRVVRCARPS